MSAERQHDLHQDEADPEIDLARCAVRAVDHDLHEVQRQQHDHRLGREVMHAAQQPAGRHLVLDVVHAFPGGLAAGAVRRPQHQAGDDLHEEAKRERAAPDVAPPRPARNVLVQRIVHERAVAGAVIQPIEEAAHPTGILSATPARNRWNATQHFLRAVVVDQLDLQRIEAAQAGAEKLFAVLGKPAFMAGAFEAVVAGVELDRAAQVRAGGGERGHLRFAVCIGRG